MDILKLVDVVKKFRGHGEDVDRWFQRFELSFKLVITAKDDAEMKQKMAEMMPVFLDGPAFCTWDQLNGKSKADFEQVKASLKRVFGLGKAAAWGRLKSLRLFPGDPIDVLADEAKSLLRTITGADPSGALVALAVLDAVPPEVKEKIYMQHGEKMELDDVISSIKALLSTENAGASTDATSAFAMTAREQRENRRDFPQSLRCQGCLRRGHVRANCTTVCFLCGRAGHLRRFCPQRQTSNTPAYDSRSVSGNGSAGLAAADSVGPAART
jgi:hypothetical protein